MLIKSLQLTNFRNYQQKKFDFADKGTILVGPNAVGKTNVLEALYLLAVGKSPRVGVEAEMIANKAEISRLSGGVVDSKGQKTKLEIVLTKGKLNGKPVAKKRYFVNGVARRMTNFIGNLRAVFFRPEDLDIILGSPHKRREYLDSVLMQVDREYYRSLLVYKKGLRQRNKILIKIREQATSKRALYFWDNLLIKNGQYLHQQRAQLLHFIGRCQADQKLCIQTKYDHSVISQARLDQYQQASIATGMTLVGPHRDDFIIIQNKRNLAFFGSRGEQRLAVLVLRLAQLQYIKEVSGQRPVLLLDDIFSELDEAHRTIVLQTISRYQTIMSTTEANWLDANFLHKIKVIKLDS